MVSASESHQNLGLLSHEGTQDAASLKGHAMTWFSNPAHQGQLPFFLLFSLSFLLLCCFLTAFYLHPFLSFILSTFYYSSPTFPPPILPNFSTLTLSSKNILFQHHCFPVIFLYFFPPIIFYIV